MKASKKINKTFRLDAALLKTAKETLGYQSLTETIEETLKIALNNKKHLNLLKKAYGKFKNFTSLYE